jgi:hypothetical protein
VIEENEPQRDAAKQIQPQIAFARRRDRHQASFNGGGIRLQSTRPPAGRATDGAILQDKVVRERCDDSINPSPRSGCARGAELVH